MKHIGWQITVVCGMGILSSCGDRSRVSHYPDGYFNKEQTVLNVNPGEEYYDSVFNALSSPQLVILQENDTVIFAEISKIISKENRFFILDSHGSRTAVSFHSDGTPAAKYGSIGQGPGEYVRPWDIEVRDSCVYILDSNLKKLIRYSLDGTFIEEKSIPFIANAFTILDNRNVVFNLYPDGEGGPQLCLTDANMNVIDNYLPYPKGYLGGWCTPNIFHNYGDRISYYRAPQDTLIVFDKDLNASSSLAFDFGSRSIPDEAKIDFIPASDNGKLKGKWMLADSPIHLSGGLLAGIILDDMTQYSFIADPATNRIGMKRVDERKSVLDVMEPCTADEDGNLITYANVEYLEDLEDFEDLDESIKAGLKDTNRLLIIYPFAKLDSSSH